MQKEHDLLKNIYTAWLKAEHLTFETPKLEHSETSERRENMNEMAGSDLKYNTEEHSGLNGDKTSGFSEAPKRSDSSEAIMRMYKNMEARIEDGKFQRILVLIIVSCALLLDNMLYMVIVPIIPDYLRKVNAWDTRTSYGQKNELKNGAWVNSTYITDTYYEGEDTSLGFLFASKAFIQLIANPVSGTLIDRVGYEVPMVFGLFVMFTSTTIFAFGETYTFLFLARCMQGIGSAFADTAGLGNYLHSNFISRSFFQLAIWILLQVNIIIQNGPSRKNLSLFKICFDNSNNIVVMKFFVNFFNET